LLPDEIISEIRERIDMVTLVGEYVRLTKRGSNHVGLCPFHAEKTPSFNVSAAHKFFHCFGCKESGDAFSFVMRLEGVSFPQAARLLAERAGVAVPEDERPESAAERRERELRERQYALTEEACSFYEQQLSAQPASHVARAEIEARGVLPETAARFRLGYAPHAWDALAQHFARKKLDLAVAEALGLVGRRKSGQGHYDRFRGRLMFPVRDLGGRVVAFSGRLLPDPSAPPDARGKGDEPKYMNSPEGPLYHKGSVLYGLHEARVELRRHGWALLCEGNFDLLALHQSGFGNAVAPMGTAFTATQAKLLARFGDRVTLLFDGDAAGEKAVRAAFPLLAQHSLRGLVAQLPPGEDPDTYLRARGADALRTLMASAQGIIEYLIDAEADRAGASAGDRAAAVQALAPVLRTVTSPVEMELYLQRVAQRFGLPDAGAVRRQLRAANSAPTRREDASRHGKPADNSMLAGPAKAVTLPGLQTELLGVLLDRPVLFASPYAGQLEGLLIPELRDVHKAAAACVQESGALDLTALFSALDDSTTLPWLKERLAVQKYDNRGDAEEVLERGIRSLRRESLGSVSQRLFKEITEARRRGDEVRAVELSRERLQIEKERNLLLDHSPKRRAADKGPFS
jgi:DNA primase